MKSRALPCFLCLALCLVAGTSHQATGAPSLAGKRVLWLGDSITADGKYVSYIEYYLNRQSPMGRFDIISIGLASETVSGLSERNHPFPRPCLFERLQRALDQIKPEIVVACYGMNDGIYHPQSPERMRAFQSGISNLIVTVKASQAELILLTPAPFDTLPIRSRVLGDGAAAYSYAAPYEKYDSVLADYSRWETTRARRKAFVVDLRTAMVRYQDRQRAQESGFSFSADGIHPSAQGHLLMALTILKSFGINIKAADLETELSRINSDPLFKLVRQHREGRSQGWLPFIGYTRGETVKSPEVEPSEAASKALQEQIDQLRKGK
jgi:lysophospholipase L1-like esterase